MLRRVAHGSQKDDDEKRPNRTEPEPERTRKKGKNPRVGDRERDER